MKHTNRIILALLLALALCALTACGAETPADPSDTTTAATTAAQSGLWANAAYSEDREFGTGKTTVQVEVKVEDKSVTFTIHTDKTMLGDALLDHALIAGDMGEYGLYVKVVNGVTADYDVDMSYWLLCQNGETLMTGVDTTEIIDGAHYELVYTR